MAVLRIAVSGFSGDAQRLEEGVECFWQLAARAIDLADMVEGGDLQQAIAVLCVAVTGFPGDGQHLLISVECFLH